MKNAKASCAFAQLAFGAFRILISHRRFEMRKQTYLRFRRVLRITKELLVIVLMILAIFIQLQVL